MTYLHPNTADYDTPEKISSLLYSMNQIQDVQAELSTKVKESEGIHEELATTLENTSEVIESQKAQIEELKSKLEETETIESQLQGLRVEWQETLFRSSDKIEELTKEKKVAEKILGAINDMEDALKL